MSIPNEPIAEKSINASTNCNNVRARCCNVPTANELTVETKEGLFSKANVNTCMASSNLASITLASFQLI